MGVNRIKVSPFHLAVLNYKHWYCEAAKEAGTCAIHNTIKADDIPKEHLETYLKNKQL